MKVLLIDSATDTFCVALGKGKRVAGEMFFERPRGQLLFMMPSLMELFRITGLSAEEIDFIGVTSGPGSFTGLRLALATARTIGQVLGRPLVTVNTLDAIAGNVMPRGDEVVCSALDARRGEIFASFYRVVDGALKSISGYRAFKAAEFASAIENLECSRCIITGNALERYEKPAGDAGGVKAVLLPPSYWYPRAPALMALALAGYHGGRAVSCYEASPFYMRKSDAEERQERAETTQ
ncbi:MAG: tRNA (adenosine(37)-N6)-threonylcarbamoyltransferase complex dimerization subunit type 1 TsaB [Candidatus Eremiobacteraeota bacterium]|nr:tRNA (adenosine(37)-N6)-threonylcarbamoyltransferase complex dimerization subunit type 1 TsaB [Candidatus Eremiobacteraeota bacterium]